jgi:hypothetical protein
MAEQYTVVMRPVRPTSKVIDVEWFELAHPLPVGHTCLLDDRYGIAHEWVVIRCKKN